MYLLRPGYTQIKAAVRSSTRMRSEWACEGVGLVRMYLYIGGG
jgi:hypothetical protein